MRRQRTSCKTLVNGVELWIGSKIECVDCEDKQTDAKRVKRHEWRESDESHEQHEAHCRLFDAEP